MYLLSPMFADSVSFANRKKHWGPHSGKPFYTSNRCCYPDTAKPRPGIGSRLPLFSLPCKDLLPVAIFTVWLATGCKGSLSHILDSNSARNSALGPMLGEVTVPMLELTLRTREHWYYLWAAVAGRCLGSSHWSSTRAPQSWALFKRPIFYRTRLPGFGRTAWRLLPVSPEPHPGTSSDM